MRERRSRVIGALNGGLFSGQLSKWWSSINIAPCRSGGMRTTEMVNSGVRPVGLLNQRLIVIAPNLKGVKAARLTGGFTVRVRRQETRSLLEELLLESTKCDCSNEQWLTEVISQGPLRAMVYMGMAGGLGLRWK
jgi:hypothetical protein